MAKERKRECCDIKVAKTKDGVRIEIKGKGIEKCIEQCLKNCCPEEK